MHAALHMRGARAFEEDNVTRDDTVAEEVGGELVALSVKAGHAGDSSVEGLQFGAIVPHGDEGGIGHAVDLFAQFAVGLQGEVPQFTHLAQQGVALAAAGDVRNGFEGGFHAFQVGIVAVVHKGDALDFLDAEATLGDGECRQSSCDVLQCATRVAGGSGCQQAVGDHVFTRNGELDGYFAHADDAQGEVTALAVAGDVLSPHGGVLTTDRDALRLRLGGDVIRKVVTGGVDEGTIQRQGACEGAFLLCNGLAGAKEFNVGCTHVSDDSNLGLCHGCQWRDFARVVHAHLPDGGLQSLLRTQDAQWHPDVVVEVAQGGLALHALAQDGRQHVLGAGFAAGACEPHDGDIAQLPAPPCGEFLQGGKGIFHQNDAAILVHSRGLFGEHECGCSLLSGLHGKAVAVEAFPHKGEEDAAHLQCTAIGGESRCDSALTHLQEASACCCCKNFWGDVCQIRN